MSEAYARLGCRTWAPRNKAASVGRIRNSSLACTSLALHWIEFVSCEYRLLHRREASSVAGRAGMLFDLRRHDEPFRRPCQLAASFILSAFLGGLHAQTISGCRRSALGPITNYHVGTPGLCNFAHCPKIASGPASFGE